MIKITKDQWNKIHKDYKTSSKDKMKGCFLGCIEKNGGTTVVYENKHFIITNSLTSI